jgi:hypothetical protein
MKRKELDEEFKTESDDLGRMSMNRRTFMKIAGMAAGALALGNFKWVHPAYGSAQFAQTPLAGNRIPQFVDALPHFAGARINGAGSLAINMVPHSQQVLSTGTPWLGESL